MGIASCKQQRCDENTPRKQHHSDSRGKKECTHLTLQNLPCETQSVDVQLTVTSVYYCTLVHICSLLTHFIELHSSL